MEIKVFHLITWLLGWTCDAKYGCQTESTRELRRFLQHLNESTWNPTELVFIVKFAWIQLSGNVMAHIPGVHLNCFILVVVAQAWSFHVIRRIGALMLCLLFGGGVLGWGGGWGGIECHFTLDTKTEKRKKKSRWEHLHHDLLAFYSYRIPCSSLCVAIRNQVLLYFCKSTDIKQIWHSFLTTSFVSYIATQDTLILIKKILFLMMKWSEHMLASMRKGWRDGRLCF